MYEKHILCEPDIVRQPGDNTVYALLNENDKYHLIIDCKFSYNLNRFYHGIWKVLWSSVLVQVLEIKIRSSHLTWHIHLPHLVSFLLDLITSKLTPLIPYSC